MTKTKMSVLSDTGLAMADRWTEYREELRRYCDGYAFEGANDYRRGLSSDDQFLASDLPVVLGLEVL